MFLHVKVEKKIRHNTLSSREWINVLLVTPSSEDPPLGLIDRQSRLSLGSTDMGGNVDRTISAAEGLPDSLHVCSWRYLDGSDLKAGIVTEESWVSGVEIVPISLRVVGTRTPGASVGQ